MKEPSQLKLLGIEASKEYIRNNTLLNESLTKIATDHGLTRAELDRVAEVANTNTYLELVDKAPEHYVEFPLADSTQVAKSLELKKVSHILEEQNLYPDIDKKPEFSFSLYEGVEAEEAEKVASVPIEKYAFYLRDFLKIISTEAIEKKASCDQNIDDLKKIARQEVLKGTSVEEINHILKTAAPLLSKELIYQTSLTYPKNITKTASAELGIPNPTSTLFKVAQECEQNFIEMVKLASEVEYFEEPLHMLKLAGIGNFFKGLAKFWKKNPRTSAAIAGAGVTAPTVGITGAAYGQKKEEVKNKKYTPEQYNKAMAIRKMLLERGR